MQEIPEFVTSIRQAAELTGLTEDTIRYYERIGLLPYAERKPNGHRHYTREQILGIRFVMRLKATGMTLEEIRQYLELTRQGPGALAGRYSLLEAHHDAISAEIAQLQETQRIIRYKLEHFRELTGNPDIGSNDCETPGDSSPPSSRQDAAPAVITPEKARILGIETLHQQMPSGERRFRLLSADGSAYIRTEAPDQGGWQNSHYHKEITETYIVQKGWIVYVGLDAAGQLSLNVLQERDSIVVKPFVHHNIYMPPLSVTHVVKTGGGGLKTDWFPSPALDELTLQLPHSRLEQLRSREQTR